MKYIYILLPNDASYEDIIIIDNETDAISQSIKYPSKRVEIFCQEDNTVGYKPTYNYYKQGFYINNNNSKKI
jgi:hypothetical protein